MKTDTILWTLCYLRIFSKENTPCYDGDIASKHITNNACVGSLENAL